MDSYTVRTGLIFAAGKGERMGLGIPKCLIEIGGDTFLDRQITWLKGCGVERIFVIAGHQYDKVIEVCERHGNVQCVYNPFYESCGIVSTAYIGAQHAYGTIIRMDGDIFISDAADYATELEVGDCFINTTFQERQTVSVMSYMDGRIQRYVLGQYKGKKEYTGIEVYRRGKFELMVELFVQKYPGKMKKGNFIDCLNWAMKSGMIDFHLKHCEGFYEVDTQEDLEVVKNQINT